jgi:hypothetical protein
MAEITLRHIGTVRWLLEQGQSTILLVVTCSSLTNGDVLTVRKLVALFKLCAAQRGPQVSFEVQCDVTRAFFDVTNNFSFLRCVQIISNDY